MPSRRISVIIPARDEASGLGRTLARLRRASPYETIVVDGHSTDGTAETAAAWGARVLTAPPGRGGQMNVGAAAATGDTLLFLHADTLVPPDMVDQVERCLGRPGVVAGAFSLRIDAPDRSLRIIERLVAWRSTVRGLPFGDQAIFVSAGLFRREGRYRDLPAMEDYELIRRLRRLGAVAIAPAPVVTSARRWRRSGVWTTTLLNQACVVAYRLGVSPHRIARWRRHRGRGDAPYDGEFAPAARPSRTRPAREGARPCSA